MINQNVRKIQGLQALEIESNRKIARAQSKAGQAASTTGMIQSAFGLAHSLASPFAGPGGASNRSDVSRLFGLD